MASMAVAQVPSGLHYQRSRSLCNPQMRIRESTPKILLRDGILRSISIQEVPESFSRKLSFSHVRALRPLTWSISLSAIGSELNIRELRPLTCSISAVGTGLEASITDPKENDISLQDVKIVVESRDDDKIHVSRFLRESGCQVRVDLTEKETQKAFDEVLMNLARTAPPIPGFRKMKGGKTSNVPKSFLLQILGRDRVTKFLIQEIVSSTIGDFVNKQNLRVKSKCNTTQSAEELKSAFTPGKEFGFNATLEIEKPETETSRPSSS